MIRIRRAPRRTRERSLRNRRRSSWSCATMSSAKASLLSGGPVILSGHLKKLKTMKKKYFVLRGEAPGCLACLEYYDTKKKFDNRQPPKRSILLHSCFNINKRGDTKHKHVIALYTKDECFCLILDTEKELDEWLEAMLRLQSGDVPDGEQPRPTFEHIWQVTMQKKGLGARKNIHGPYRLCLTDQTLSLVKIGAQEDSDSIEISLNYIRRCGFADDIFYIEVGRSAVTGDGEFWMAVEDNNIALNMNDVITTAMKTSKTRWKLKLLENKDKDHKDKDNKDRDKENKDRDNKDKDIKDKDNKDKDSEMEPRQRSSSANEASKPISVLQRRHTGQKFGYGYSPLEEQRTHKELVEPLQEQITTSYAPTQCNQSRNISSTNTVTAVAGTGAWTTGHATTNANSAGSARRRHSIASHPHSVNNSQFAHVTTAATTNATTTTVTTTTITATTTTITTTTTTINTTTTITATITTTTTATISHQRTLSLPLAAVIISQTQPSKRSVLRCTTVRDCCDSLPSRARTNSEGQSMVTTVTGLNSLRGIHAISHVPRPHSMCGRTSYSPPVASMPISPGSDMCSSDSAGSSPSMEDCGENIMEESTVSRYGHSLTPDEPVILDKKGDDYIYWSTSHPHLKYSPNFKSHSPSQSSYQSEMYSPCGSSPGRGGAYMPMSPAATVHSHSRGSSLVEESNVEGYVPMAPVGDDGYVDMDPLNNHNGHFPDDISQNDGSSCSVTSGTPSTDLRFSEYHLDKVTSFLTPGEDMQARPTRAYSVGSRPEQANRHRKNRLDITLQDANRVRAFSVGSRSKRPEIGRLANIMTAPLPAGSDSSNSKSSSAPLLSSSWGHNSGCSGASDRMEDLMELDFTKSSAPTALSSPPSTCSQPQSQPQSYSTATDTSSYVDMSPGQAPVSTTASYVDMSINKINRNNNNNTITANHNHSHMHISSLAFAHKPIITTLKPVEEAEGPYMKMDGTTEDWAHSDASPKQLSSPIQEDIYHTNGPPGSTRTAPVDLPQPRRPPEGYVEMSFKARPTLDQDYINMSMGANNRNNRKTRTGSRKEKSRSQPIAIQAGNKPSKIPSFLPLNGSPMSESLASTPASPPRATPTGSSATIFPFSLNSPQSPVKPFTKKSDEFSTADVSKQNKNNDYAVLEPPKTVNSSMSLSSNSNRSTETSKLDATKEKPSSSIGKNTVRVVPKIISHTEHGTFGNIITKKLSDLTVSKPRLVTASPNTSPTLTGFKPSTVQQPKPSSPKFIDETPTPTPTSTPTPTPSPLDSEGYEKLQPGATILHYARLDLPEIGNPTPVSPASTQENFTYAEIDFAKLRQS